MKIKHFSLVFLSVVLVFGCTSKVKSEKPKIAVVVSTLNNPWFVLLAESATENAKKLGYDAILLNPTDSDGSISSILKVKTAGIPVFYG